MTTPTQRLRLLAAMAQAGQRMPESARDVMTAPPVTGGIRRQLAKMADGSTKELVVNIATGNVKAQPVKTARVTGYNRKQRRGMAKRARLAGKV